MHKEEIVAETGKFDTEVNVIDTEAKNETVSGTDSGENFFEGWIDGEHKHKTYAEQKFIALYKCRYLLSKIGTMEERRICGRKLKQMKTKGLNVI